MAVTFSQSEKNYLEYKFKKNTISLKENVVIDHHVISWLKTMDYQEVMFIEVVGFLPQSKFIHENDGE